MHCPLRELLFGPGPSSSLLGVALGRHPSVGGGPTACIGLAASNRCALHDENVLVLMGNHENPACKGKEGGDGKRDSRVASMGCKLKRRGWAKSLGESRGGERGQGEVSTDGADGRRPRRVPGPAVTAQHGVSME